MLIHNIVLLCWLQMFTLNMLYNAQAYQKEIGEIRKKYDLLLEENAKLQYQLEIMHKQLEQLQVDYVKDIERYRKFKDDDVAIQTDTVCIPFSK